MNSISFLLSLFIIVAFGFCSLFLAQLTMAQQINPIKTAQVLLEDANDILNSSNDTNKAITRLNLALGLLKNRTNYDNSSSIQTAVVLIEDALQAIRDHHTPKASLRLNLADQELAVGPSLDVRQLKTNTENSSIAGENSNVTKGQILHKQITGQDQSSVNFLTYVNSTFGYSLDYPLGWRILHIENQPNTTYLLAPYGNVIVFINVNSSIDQILTTKEMANKIVEASRSYIGFRLIDRNANDYYLAGHPAARVESTAKLFNPVIGEIQQRMVGLASIINGKGYAIAASAPDSRFSEYSTIFEHMISSFRVSPAIQNQMSSSKKQPLVFNQKVTMVNGSDITLRGVDPDNKSLTGLCPHPTKNGSSVSLYFIFY